jgi:hypothetical protein
MDVREAWSDAWGGLQAIMMGPFLMAGLTNSSRSIAADPATVSDYISEIQERQFGELAASLTTAYPLCLVCKMQALSEIVCRHADHPEGSKMLSGDDQQYVIAPLGNIVEQNYTAYFDFQSEQLLNGRVQALAAS